MSIQSLCLVCPCLRTLCLGNNEYDLDGDFIAHHVTQYCTLIESMSIERWTVTDAGLGALAAIHTLKQLKLSSIACSSAAIQRVLVANRNLTLLVIMIASIADALVSCIGSCCRNLTRLELYSASASDHTINKLSENALLRLFRGCPMLQSFTLSTPGRVDTTALRALFKHCNHLTELVIGLVGLPPADELLPDIEPILYTHYPSLSKLRMTGDVVIESALRDIFTYCINLHEVNLTNYTHITDNTIKVMTQYCSMIEVLEISHCKSLTVTGILSVATYCSNLKVLHLDTILMNDDILIQLSLHCPCLTSLKLFYRYDGRLTVVGIRAVLQGCTGLTFLTIHSEIMPPLTLTAELMKLRQLYPHIIFDIC